MSQRPPQRAIPRFIVGMSRAGTTWLGKCLNGHPDAAVFGETLFWGRGYVEPGPDGKYTGERLQQVLNRLKGGSVYAFSKGGPGSLKRVTSQNLPEILAPAFAEPTPPMTPAQVFERVGEAIARAEGKTVAIEKTPHHLNWIDRIIAAMPKARFVALIRDPYGFMLSYKHQGDRKPAPVRRAFRRLYHPLACALVWRSGMRSATAAARRYPEQVLLVETEQFQQDGEAALDRIQRFLLLEPVKLAHLVPPDNTSFPTGERVSLRADDVFWMNLVNRKMIRQATLQLLTTPFEPLRIIGSVLRLPFGVVCNLFALRERVSGSLWRYLWRWLRPAPG